MTTTWPRHGHRVTTTFFTLCVGQAGGWADPSNPQGISAAEWAARSSYEGELTFEGAAPRNPRGRTGMRERGYLGK